MVGSRAYTWTDLSWVTRWPFRVDSHRELVNCMIALWETPVREVCRRGPTEVGVQMEGGEREREPVKHSHATTKFKGSGEPVNYWTIFFDTSNWPLKDGMSTMTSLVAAGWSIYPPKFAKKIHHSQESLHFFSSTPDKFCFAFVPWFSLPVDFHTCEKHVACKITQMLANWFFKCFEFSLMYEMMCPLGGVGVREAGMTLDHDLLFIQLPSYWDRLASLVWLTMLAGRVGVEVPSMGCGLRSWKGNVGHGRQTTQLLTCVLSEGMS